MRNGRKVGGARLDEWLRSPDRAYQLAADRTGACRPWLRGLLAVADPLLSQDSAEFAYSETGGSPPYTMRLLRAPLDY